MKRSQLIVVLAAIVAVVVVGVASQGNGKSHNGGAAEGSSTPANAIVVTVASSPEKLELLQKLAADFNRTGTRANGRAVVASVRNANSGDEEIALAKASRDDRGDGPVVWSPASSLWARMLNHDADRNLAPADNPSIVHTPLVLAMWEPMARALGWPNKAIGYADVLRLAQDPRGWSAYGHPEFGQFKLVHTNPSVSTSGLEAVTAAYYAATGKKEGLTIADVARPSVARQIRGIEKSIVHYGDTTIFIEDQLRKHGPSYASAVAMEETTLIKFNRDRGGQPKLVAIYPTEGTFYSDSPYVILKARWVDDAERAGATAFQRYIAGHLTPQMAAKYGFRPADPGADPLPPVDAAHGTDPTQPVRELGRPDPDVLARIRQAWFDNRKAANIELVVDTSGSMDDDAKLAHAKDGLQAFLNQLSPRDRVGLTTFSDYVHRTVPLRPFAENGSVLRATVRNLVADGSTALYEATGEAVDDIAALHDTKRINAVVLLSDGEDTVGRVTMPDLVPRLGAHAGPETEPIRVFTIGYGAEADKDILGKIAEAADGRFYEGQTNNIESVYRGISSFF